MGTRSKAKRDRKTSEKAAFRSEVLQRKREKYQRERAVATPPVSRQDKLTFVLDLLWRVTGGPIVWITGWSPFARPGKRGSNKPPA